MKHAKDLLWILLVKEVYSFNLSQLTNVDETSSTMSQHSSFTTSNTTYMLKISAAKEETSNSDIVKKIQYYNFIETSIWRIFPPILLGKKKYPLISTQE